MLDCMLRTSLAVSVVIEPAILLTSRPCILFIEEVLNEKPAIFIRFIDRHHGLDRLFRLGAWNGRTIGKIPFCNLAKHSVHQEQRLELAFDQMFSKRTDHASSPRAVEDTQLLGANVPQAHLPSLQITLQLRIEDDDPYGSVHAEPNRAP
jgi:hypothetical protein